MHVLHVLDHSIPLQDGYSHRTISIIRAQRAMGWTTAHVTSGKHGKCSNSLEAIDGLEFYRTRQPRGWLSRLPAGAQLAVIRDLMRRLEVIVDRERPNAVHVHSPALNGVAALAVADRHRIPVVYEVRSLWEDAAVDHGTSTEWGLRYRATRALETWVLQRSARVTTICQGLRAEIESRGIPHERITLIPNGVDVERFQQRGTPDARLVEALGLRGSTVVGFIGSFYAYEGLVLLVDAMRHLSSEGRGIKALLVGGGQDLEHIRSKIASLGLTGTVVTTGNVPHVEVAKYYNLIDMLVYPRMSMRLTEMVTPLKPLEAMARQQLVLASDVGGHRELIRHGETGFLFRPNDAVALASAIRELVDHREKWVDVQMAARRYVESERSWAICTAPYRDVFQSLTGRNGQGWP